MVDNFTSCKVSSSLKGSQCTQELFLSWLSQEHFPIEGESSLPANCPVQDIQLCIFLSFINLAKWKPSTKGSEIKIGSMIPSIVFAWRRIPRWEPSTILAIQSLPRPHPFCSSCHSFLPSFLSFFSISSALCYLLEHTTSTFAHISHLYDLFEGGTLLNVFIPSISKSSISSAAESHLDEVLDISI